MVAKWANFEIEYGDSSDDATPGGFFRAMAVSDDATPLVFFKALVDIGKHFWNEVRWKD
jgi:hypothetical protein